MELLFEARPVIWGLSGRVDFFQRRPMIHPATVIEPDSPVDGSGTQL
jgi:hypothetical protein